MSRRLKIGLAVFFAIYILLNVLGKILFPPQPLFSTQSAGPEGTKAFYLLTRELGWPADRWEKPYRDLDKGLLIMVQPSPQDEEYRKVLRWVEKGGQLLLLSSETSAITDELGITFSFEEDSSPKGEKDTSKTASRRKEWEEAGFSFIDFDPEKLQIVRDTLTQDVKTLSLAHPVTVKAASPAKVLFSYNGKPAALEFRKGLGRIFFIGEPYLVTNAHIGKEDNVILLLNIIRSTGQGPLWFDEYHSGMGTGAPPSIEISRAWKLATLEAALALLLLFLYWGKRFGRPQPLPAEENGIATQYVTVMANVYRQARAREVALANICHGFRRRLASFLGVSHRLPSDEIIQLCRERKGFDNTALADLLRRVDVYLNGTPLNETDLFTLVYDLETWREENLTHARH